MQVFSQVIASTKDQVLIVGVIGMVIIQIRAKK